jgi:hypothetical protein
MSRSLFRSLITVAMLVTLIATASAAEQCTNTGNSISCQEVISTAVGMPLPGLASPSGSDPTANFTKLEILPSYLHFGLKPGDSKEQTVMVRNRDTRTITVTPSLKAQPYGGPTMMDNSWVVITPVSADIPAGESAKFTVKATVPQNAYRGSFSSLMVFTDESYPSPYPTPFPNYIHVLNLAVDVTSPPAIQISTPYISDQMESGREYHYEVTIKNTGKNQISLNPKIGGDTYPMYGPAGQQEPALTESAFTLHAPSSLQPGTSGTLNIDVRVSPVSTGYYNGYIDLGIDDPTLLEGEGRIQLNFIVWQQPGEPFVKAFSLAGDGPIAIELTSGMPGFMPSASPAALSNIPVKEPTFETTLSGPDGIVTLTPAGKVIKGTVMLNSDPLSGLPTTARGYQDSGAQYTYSYTAPGKQGTWKLTVMPRNMQVFDYKISLGSDIVNRLKSTAPLSGIPAETTMPVGNSSADSSQAAVVQK